MNSSPLFRAVLLRRLAVLALGGASCLMAGCTTLGTNVSGSFQCKAPDGVCAPSTVIDDRALAEIEQVSSTELLSPAGPYRIDGGEEYAPAPVLASAEPVSRDAPSYQLRVVFPAYVDSRGQRHERAAIQTNVRLPGRGDAVDALASRGASNGEGRGLLAAAESAPPYLAVAAPTSIDQAAAAVTAPSQLAVGPGPIDRIKDDVEATLASKRSRRQAASFPGTPE